MFKEFLGWVVAVDFGFSRQWVEDSQRLVDGVCVHEGSRRMTISFDGDSEFCDLLKVSFLDIQVELGVDAIEDHQAMDFP